MRALWRGESVTRRGRFVTLEDARVRPLPPGGRLPIEVAAKSARLLPVVARHADIWNVNWPAIPARVEAAAAELARACRAERRDPAEIRRRLWIFARPEPLSRSEALAEFRRWNPWFRDLSDAELAPALAVGKPAECRERIASLAAELRAGDAGDRPVGPRRRPRPRGPRGAPRGRYSLTRAFAVS